MTRETLILNVFPALAGMNRFARVILQHTYSVPRARGDEPFEDMLEEYICACSPRSRG